MEACGVELHYPTHSTTRRQAITHNPFHHITTVEYVRFAGYN
jgi:hypothetical protein